MDEPCLKLTGFLCVVAEVGIDELRHLLLGETHHLQVAIKRTVLRQPRCPLAPDDNR